MTKKIKKTVQKYRKPKKKNARHPWQLVVFTVYGPNAGKQYVRTFPNQGKMQAYMRRNTEATGNEVALTHTVKRKTPKELSNFNIFKNWVKEGLGAGEMTKEEEEYIEAFVNEHGRVPKPWEDPNFVGRVGKFVEKVFEIGMVAGGVGLGVSGVKAAVTGTKLATSGVARAATKTAVKSAAKKAATALAKKRSVKEALKVAGKGTAKAVGRGFDVQYKAEIAGMFTKMGKKGISNIKQGLKATK